MICIQLGTDATGQDHPGKPHALLAPFGQATLGLAPSLTPGNPLK